MKARNNSKYLTPIISTTLTIYSVPNQSNITLKVYEILRSEVRTLINKEQPHGNFEVEFDGSDLTSGIYFYRLQAGDFVEIKKMIIVKYIL